MPIFHKTVTQTRRPLLITLLKLGNRTAFQLLIICALNYFVWSGVVSSRAVMRNTVATLNYLGLSPRENVKVLLRHFTSLLIKRYQQFLSFYRKCFLLTVPAYEFEEGFVSKKECRYLKYLGEYSPPEDTPFSSEPRCTCDAHYMVANYRDVLYCINNFISPGGQVDNYTACTADCCSKNCGVYFRTRVSRPG